MHVGFYVLCALVIVVLVMAGLLIRAQQRQTKTIVAWLQERSEQLEELNQTLQRRSVVDALTGLANRRHFDESLEMEWRRAYRGNFPISLVMIDIDFFKNYNDLYGHQKGDDTLRRVADELRGVLKRPGDLAARYGGEEFVIILQGSGPDGGALVAGLLRRKVEVIGIAHERAPAGVVTISLGVATALPRQGGSPADLIAEADRALYEAKQQGRNRVVVHRRPQYWPETEQTEPRA